jgi:hypothetical protein
MYPSHALKGPAIVTVCNCIFHTSEAVFISGGSPLYLHVPITESLDFFGFYIYMVLQPGLGLCLLFLRFL